MLYRFFNCLTEAASRGASWHSRFTLPWYVLTPILYHPLSTVPLLGDADASTVTEALLALPGSLADSVTVTQSSISGGNRYTVTFVAGLGKICDSCLLDTGLMPIRDNLRISSWKEYTVQLTRSQWFGLYFEEARTICCDNAVDVYLNVS